MSPENRMSDVTRRNKRKSRRGCGRNQIGGNVGAGYAVVPTPVDPTHPFIGNSARIDNITSCRAQTPDYAITPPPARGLPGMYGGKRRRGMKGGNGTGKPPRHTKGYRAQAYIAPEAAQLISEAFVAYASGNRSTGSKKISEAKQVLNKTLKNKGIAGVYKPSGSRGAHRRTMKGGAYTFNLTSEPVPIGAALSQGGYPEVQKLGCQGTIINPLNQGPHTGSNPTGPNSVNQWALGASIANKMSGGGGVPTGVQNPVGTGSPYLDLKAIPGTPGGTGSPFLTSPTAGYDNKPSTWTDSVGAPVQLQIPYNARIMNPACLKTGGGSRKKSPIRTPKYSPSKSAKKAKTPRSRTRRANRKH